MDFDWLIVGAGFSGSVIARELAERGNFTVKIIDKRPHLGGNAFDSINEFGHRIHHYGPHIFHTNSVEVFSYLSRFTDWVAYEHKVLGVIPEFEKIPIPFNFDSLKILDTGLYESSMQSIRENFVDDSEIPVLKLMKSTNSALKAIGELAYETVFRGYSEKQWGVTMDKLEPSVGSRVPIRMGWGAGYFTDKFQYMPKNGYSELFQNLLDHDKICVSVNTSFQPESSSGRLGTVYTGPLDALFNYQFGHLPYRSLRFNYEHLNADYFQTVAQENYPLSEDFTRITEFKRFTGENGVGTTIMREYPEAYTPNVNEPYYPVPTKSNHDLYKKYAEAVGKRDSKVITLGRLADYKYYNMDQVVAKALKTSRDLLT